MSAPTHHLDDDVLLAYVAGTTTESVALVAACHLTLCAKCRERAAGAETVGGALLDRGPADPLSEDVLHRVLARLDEASPAEQAAPIGGSARPFVFEGVPLPRPLARYLEPGDRAGDVRRAFRFLAPGIRGIDLPVVASPPVRTRLLRLAPRIEIPRHGHAAPEFTLVFSGGLTDGGEHYGRGDVRFRDTAAVHVQLVDPDQPCIALVVNEGALLPQTWGGKVLSFLFDR
jgi:putative transcriptional regulator